MFEEEKFEKWWNSIIPGYEDLKHPIRVSDRYQGHTGKMLESWLACTEREVKPLREEIERLKGYEQSWQKLRATLNVDWDCGHKMKSGRALMLMDEFESELARLREGRK